MMATNNATPKKRPLPCEIFTGDTITVTVGSNARKYQVNKALTMYCSGNFLGVLESVKTEEGKANTVELLDIESYTFEAFADWMYTQRLTPCGNWRARFALPTAITSHKACVLLYIFAHRFQVPNLKEAVKKELLKVLTPNGACHDATTVAFQKLPEDNPVLDMLVDAHCQYWKPGADFSTSCKKLEEVPAEFLRRVVCKYASAIDDDNFYLVPSKYQELDLEVAEDKKEPPAKKLRIKQ
ncbi:hypothetical protein T440DRAFT_556314 [Plenodomus tracheiphilus IPT5]|uniref:BTB domain-containing protein n=1 Tax=Plenodomus tracheiphilus IPT5 TaxID=1408161 RepID=A0A6A7B3Y8_9PLEO|nr:hypothetical protein T440DRAFT_556314 [Plenodomus tracheiphilus IPT5]